MIDALSRLVALLSSMHAQVTGFDAFKELYLEDSSFEQIYIELMNGDKRYHIELMNDYFVAYKYIFQIAPYYGMSFVRCIMRGTF